MPADVCAPTLSTPTPLLPRIVDVSVPCVAHHQVGPGLYRLTVAMDPFHSADFGRPGQFIMLALPGEDFLFRRAFSWADVDPDTHQATLYYKVVGHGTQRLTTLSAGQSVSLLTPLGNPFLPVANPGRTLLVAGGVGLPPLLWWAIDQRRNGQSAPQAIVGARTAEDLADFTPRLTQWLGLDQATLCTDDGSTGTHGNVVTALDQQKHALLASIDDVLLCGPNPMMAAVVRWFGVHHPTARVQVSLENHMPCGTGACFGCVVAPSATNLSQQGQPIRVCLQGPVFNAQDIAWTDRGPLVDDFAGHCTEVVCHAQ
jgi:dihydroorotate dehydrogenase electron transfer subunit